MTRPPTILRSIGDRSDIHVMRPLLPLAMLFAPIVTAGTLNAETHRSVPSTFASAFSATQAPVMRIKSGDRVITSIVDDEGIDAQGKSVAQGPNPLTGPFFIEGAEPGDLLVVTIDRLEPNRATGTSTSVMRANAYDAGGLGNRPDPARVSWIIDKEKGVVRFDLQAAGRNTDWRSRFASPAFEMPLRPTLGSIGVAPAGQDATPATTPGPFGGNMVSAGVAAGARVMLPVFQRGALLFLGHGHARQGDGAITGSGVETSLDVEFGVEVVKKKPWPHSTVVRPSTVVGEFEMAWPRIETGDSLMAVGSAPALLAALQHATLELHHWLDDDFGLSEKAVNIFVGQAMEYEIANVADGLFTVVAKVRKSYLPRASATP